MATKPFEIVYPNVTSLSFYPDGAYFVTGDSSGFLRQWSAIHGQQVNLWVMNTKEQINGVAVSNDGQWIISHGNGNKVTIWSAITVIREREIDIAEQTSASAGVCAISDDFTRFACGTTDNTLRIFDIASGNKLAQIQRMDAVADAKFSADASRIAIATHYYKYREDSRLAYSDNRYDSELWVAVYDATSGNRLSEFSSKLGFGKRSSQLIFRIAWSSDDQEIFVASPSMITCFEMSTNPPITSCIQLHASGSRQQASNLSIITSGKFIACSVDSSLSFWDCVSRKQIGQNILHAEPINCMAVTHDGRRLACGHGRGITVHNLEGVIPEHLLAGIVSLPLIRVRSTALKSWVQGNPTETEAILADEIAQRLTPNRDSLAVYSLVQGHLGEWRTALEKAEMSLQIKPSLIGRIARSIALVSAGKQEVGFHELDLVFWDCDPSDNKLLFVIKSVFLFVCDKREEAVSYLRYFIDTCDGKMKDMYLQVLGMMYLKQGDYGNAVETLGSTKDAFTTDDRGPLMTLFIIFNWNFENLKSIAWQRACERLYATGSVKEIGDTLLKMVNPLPENKKERAHGTILQEIITRSGDVTLLAWTGKSSTYNSCLPSSPEVYVQISSIPSSHTHQSEALPERIAELREIVPLPDALMAHGSVTRSQPAVFRVSQFHLLLPCIVFRVKALRKEQGNDYHAETVGLGDVTLTTVDPLPLRQPRRLAFVNPWIHHLRDSHGFKDEDGSDTESDVVVGGCAGADIGRDIGLAHEPMIEEVQTPPSPRRASDAEVYTQALELIARLGQPFSALLLFKQSDGVYKRVAADHEIVVHGVKDDALRNLRVEVLEIL